MDSRLVKDKFDGWEQLLKDGLLSSLWLLERGDRAGPLKFHGALIPPLAEGILRRWSRPGDWVWAPLAGSGTVGDEAHRLGRHCLMSDLTPTRPDIFKADALYACPLARPISIDGHKKLAPAIQQTLPPDTTPGDLFKFDLIVLHPPYYNTLRFSDDPEDLSNRPSLSSFLFSWRVLVANVGCHLRAGGYLVIVCGDVWITQKQARHNGDPPGHCPLAYRVMDQALAALNLWDKTAVLKARVTKDIRGNQARAKQMHLDAYRFTDQGAVFFKAEEVLAIQKGG